MILALVGTVAALAGNSPSEPAASLARIRPIANLERILGADMRGHSEVMPHGVPTSYDWARGPRAKPIARARSFKAFTAWGQLYRCAGQPLPSRPVELRDLQSYALARGASQWRLLQRSSELAGASFPESFRGRTEPARLVRRDALHTVVRLRRGYNFHFYPRNRAHLSVRKTAAVAVVVRARLAPSASRSKACYVLSAGGDFWRTFTAPPAGSYNTADAGIGRFKRVTSQWRVFTMTDASPRFVQQHPLPVLIAPTELR